MRAPALILVAAVVTAATLAVPASAAKHQARLAPAIAIVATADQKFSPDHVVLHVNKPRTLRFTSAAGVHGIASPELGIPATMITAGTPVAIAVTPRKVGTYRVQCTIVCGPGHGAMALTFEVKP